MAYTFAAGALLFSCLALAWKHKEALTLRQNQKQAEPRWMLGVDITGSQYLERPICSAAASYAARAHAGATRKSGQPYVMHCIETAIITEQIMKMHFSDEIANRRCASALPCVRCQHLLCQVSSSFPPSNCFVYLFKHSGFLLVVPPKEVATLITHVCFEQTLHYRAHNICLSHKCYLLHQPSCLSTCKWQRFLTTNIESHLSGNSTDVSQRST